jgi:hypothetical protein
MLPVPRHQPSTAPAPAAGRPWRRRAFLLVILLSLVTVAPVTARGPAAHADASGGGGDFVPLATPFRALDTRTGVGGVVGPIPAGQIRVFPVTGLGGVPATGVSAVLVDVTTVNPAGQTYLTLWGDGQPRPGAAAMTVGPANLTLSNSAVTPVGANGYIAIANSSASTNVIVDVHGYFSTAAGAGYGGFIPVGHQRIVDTRSGLGVPAARIPAGGSVTADLGSAAVPNVTAAFVNLTVPGAASQGWLGAQPAGASGGQLSVFDFLSGTSASGAVLRLGSDHRVTFTNHSGQPIDLVVDLHGYFSSDRAAGAGYRPAAGRLLDTATSGSLLAAGATVDVQVRGRLGVPLSGVTAVAVNLIAMTSSASGYLRAWPVGGTEPATSLANFPGNNSARSDQAMIYLTSSGTIRVRNLSSAGIRLAVDLEAWFAGVTLPRPVQQFAPNAALQTLTSAGGVHHAYVDNSGQLHYAWQAAPGPVDPALWQSIGGDQRFTGQPTLVELPDSRVQLVVLNTSGMVWSRTEVAPGNPGWQPWVVLGGPLAYPPTALMNANDTVSVLGVDADGRLWQVTVDPGSGAVSDWADLGDADLTGTPQVVTRLASSPQIYVLDQSNALKASPYTAVTLPHWTTIGTNLRGTPAVTGCSGGTVRVVARGGDGTVQSAVHDPLAGTVSPWTSMGLFGPGSPSTLLNPRDGNPVVVARDADGHLNSRDSTGCGDIATTSWHQLSTLTAATDPATYEYIVGSGGEGWAAAFRGSDDTTQQIFVGAPV